MEQLNRNDILNNIQQGGKLTSVDSTENEIINSQYIHIQRISETLPKVELVADQLSTDLLNQHVVELASNNEFVNSTVGNQYYDDLLPHDLTEEDKRLAAALVAVQLVHQQKQQQFTPELLNNTSVSPLSPLQNVKIEKPTVTMVTGYFQSFDDEHSQQSIYQTQNNTSSPIQELRLPPLKKVLSNHSLLKSKGDKPLLEVVASSHESKEIKSCCKLRKSATELNQGSIGCDNFIDHQEHESDIDYECDLKPSRRSLPHKKRIPRKLKSQPNSGPINRIPLQNNSLTKGYKCQKCGVTFFTNSSLLAHKVIHLSESVNSAENGDPLNQLNDGNPITTATSNISTQNLKKCSNQLISNGFSCEICGLTAINQIKFFEHLKGHYEPNVIQVDINDQHIIGYSEDQPLIQDTFTLKSEPMQVLKIENETNLNCNHCGRIFRRKRALEAHLASVHPSIDEFSEPEDMLEGIRNVVNIQAGSPDETDTKPWRLGEDLSISDDMFLNDAKVDLKLSKNNDDKNKKRKKTIQCPQCGRTFTHRNSLLYHIRSHSGRRPHQCDVCGKGFFAANALRVHLRMHSGDKPYKCDVCFRNFRQWGDLKYHMTSIHSSSKQYQCEFCGKDFARKYSLIVHRRIHTGEKNYICEFCRKTFRASSYLVNHRRIHTGEKPYNCDICHKAFRVKSDMKRHMNIHTKEKNLTNNVINTNGVVIDNENRSNNVLNVNESIDNVNSDILTNGQIPLNLNMRNDSTDGLSSSSDRIESNTVYVWLPSSTGSILPN